MVIYKWIIRMQSLVIKVLIHLYIGLSPVAKKLPESHNQNGGEYSF